MDTADFAVNKPAGTKPGWRRFIDFPLVAMVLALAAIILALTLPTVALNLLGLNLGDLPDDTLAIINGIFVPFFAILGYKLVVTRLGEAPRDDLPFDRRLVDVPRGLLFGFLLMSVMVGVAALLGGYRVDGWGGATSWPFLFFTAGLQAGIFEELIMRGVLFRFLEEFVGSWAALIVSALIFGFGHAFNPNATVLSSAAIALEAGILLGAAYMLTRNLWLAIGIHFSWNVTQGFVWDVPVSGLDTDGMLDARPVGSELISGGAFGLEASVIAMVLGTVAAAYLLKLAIARGHVIKPWWVRRRAARSADVTAPSAAPLA